LFKTGGRGYNPAIGHNPLRGSLFTFAAVSFPQMWISSKEKRSKKENLIIVMISYNNTILLI
jgi:hypothetical protein